jgi:hypothetical protein
MAADKHHQIDFAARYARTQLKSLNAVSAIWRAEGLRLDIDEFMELRKQAEAKDIRFGSWHQGFEAFAYYAVALVTCLEWHARSRLVDLVTYKPDCIGQNDIKAIANVALTQMVSEGVTVPYLLGAAKKVNSFNDYLYVFHRLFEELRIEDQLDKLVQKRTAGTNSIHEEVTAIFTYRHQLVHEISYASIGHWNIREVWTLEEALAKVETVINLMKMIELSITENAPSDFPNRLDKEGMEEDYLSKFEASIEELENEITAAINWDDEALPAWKESVANSKKTIEAEFDFIEKTTQFWPIRYFDIRPAMRAEVLKSRLAFLTFVKSQIGD